MKSWFNTVTASVAGGVILAVILGLAREFGTLAMKQHLINLVVVWMPIWVGAVFSVVLWALLTIHRIAKGRDKEFQLWLADRGREGDERWAQNFRDREAEAVAKAAFDRNLAERLIARFEGWMGTVDRRLDAIESRLTRLEEKS